MRHCKFKGFVLTGLLLLLTTGFSYAQFAGGDGSENNPYLVETAAHLNLVRSYPTSHFRQIADIDLTPYSQGAGWEPINGFSGIYYGGGYFISNLTISRENSDNIGLFGYAEEAIFGSIRLTGIWITGKNNVGGIVGYAEDCNIYLSFAEGSLKGSSSIGGLIGYHDMGYMTESYSLVAVEGSEAVGGLIGTQSFAEIENCHAAGDVSGDGGIGGLIGIFTNSSVINCYSTGNVNGNDNTGGLIGYNQGSDITRCYSTSSVNANQPGVRIGGLIGHSDQGLGEIQHSYWNQDIYSHNNGFGTPLTTLQMLQEDFYNNWNFVEIWEIVELNPYIRETYPILRWQNVPGKHNYIKNAHVKIYQNRTFYWESFPRLIEQYDPQETAILLDPLAGIISSVSGINPENGDYIEMAWNYDDEHWDGFPIGFRSQDGYKLEFIDRNRYHLLAEGEVINPDTQITVYENRDNWIGYFIPETQWVFYAFQEAGMNFHHIREIWFEDGAMIRRPGGWIKDEYTTKVMDYGKGYEIVTDETFQFVWHNPAQSRETTDEFVIRRKPDPVHFTFSDGPNYEPFFIESIDDDDDVLEVAIFVGEECVGASVVLAYPVEVKAYFSSNHIDQDVEFILYREGSRSNQRVSAFDVQDLHSGEYQRRSIKPYQQRYSIIRLGSGDDEQLPMLQPVITLSQNFPNPYVLNSTKRYHLTEIPFYVSEEREVLLNIYNIRGQLVKNLHNGKVNAGKHTISWDGLNEQNRRVGSGVYFYRLESGDTVITRKMLIIR